MSKKKTARVNFPFHFDEGNREIADRRSCDTDRCNITAYLNRLIAEDGKRHPKPKRTP
jgi:hypothetical protein